LKPPPLGRTAFDPAKDFYTLTPEHAAYCKDLWDKNQMYTKGIFTPPGLDGTMVTFPSTLGGGNWSGLSYDPGRGLVFTNIMNIGQVAACSKAGSVRTARLARSSPLAGRLAGSGTRTKVLSAPPFNSWR
jgi:glucose dehydrogenase